MRISSNSLSWIKLEENKLTEKGCSLLSKADLTALKHLDLSTNAIGKQGFAFVKGKSWKTLSDRKFKN